MSFFSRLARVETAVLPRPVVERPRLSALDLAARSGLVLDAWQRQAVTSRAPRQLYNVTRQGGKSTAAALRAVECLLADEGALVLLVSRALRQSQELFRKCLEIYTAAGRPVPTEAESALRLEVAGGARLISLPGTTEGSIRGYSAVSLLIFDEAAQVPDPTYYSLRPTTAISAGAILALSTPFGRRGWWASAWHSAEPWERYEVTAEQCSRIPRSFLEEERRTLGEWWYRQEYQCEFMDAQTAAFRHEDIERAFREEVEPWLLP
jgi:hypothetical protein